MDVEQVPEVEPLLGYVLSTRIGSAFTEPQRRRLASIFEQEVAKSGAVMITTHSGMFVASNCEDAA